MKLAYVTGATGCVGRNLVNDLLADRENNWDIVILHRKSSDLSRLKGCRVRFQEVDLHDLESVRRAIPFNVHAIFHAAANTSHWSSEKDVQWKDNVLATRNLVTVSLEKKVERFIFTSTGAARFFREVDQPMTELIEPPYVRTKRQSELEVYEAMAKGLDAMILQPIIVVGAFDYNSYAQIFEDVRDRPIKMCFPGRISFCHAADVSAAHLQAYKTGKKGETYVLGGVHTTWKKFFEEVARVMGIRAPIYVSPVWLLRVVACLEAVVAFFRGKKPALTPELIRLVRDEPDIIYVDQARARQDLKYQSRSLEVMVKDCYDWLKVESRLK